jgi:hypothetical protein
MFSLLKLFRAGKSTQEVWGMAGISFDVKRAFSGKNKNTPLPVCL